MITSLRRDRVAGSGLGLALCKEIIDKLGGRIWLDIMPGVGSEFHFIVPFRMSS